ncbi:MAG TPA: hypothetical protein VFZ65_19560 [Planctomycetota bacterium]|nr:hypothetical protein [Planctomycetota bacterium]
MRRALPILVLGVAAAVLLWPRGDTSLRVAGPTGAVPAAEPATDAAAAPATVADPAPGKQAEAAAEHAGWMVFPDGSERPPLNGVAKAPRLAWHRRVPFTPVVRVERDASGRDWYVHENGARSTTYIDVRGVAIAEISLPTTAQPVIDEPAARTPK